MKWFYTILLVILGTTYWVWRRSVYHSSRSNKFRPASPVKRLWTSREIPTAFAPTSWQRQAFEAFRARIQIQDPQVFPCIYATKGFKANEHRCYFLDLPEPDPVPDDKTIDHLAAAFDEYAQHWRQYGPMTSLVVLTPLPAAATIEEDASKPSLSDDRQRFWDLLRAISDRDPHAWPAHIPQNVAEPKWTFTFRGERFVGLALTPRYRHRQSRFCASFTLAFQPVDIFKDLLGTPEKFASAVGKVRKLTDKMDTVAYSEDVIAVGEGRQSVSSMFFLNDDGVSSWGSLYGRIRSG